MARASFGGGVADFIVDPTSGAPGAALRFDTGLVTMWTAETGGTQYTDLLWGGDPVTAIPVTKDGQIPTFQGPDGVAAMWAEVGGGPRALIDAGAYIATLAGDAADRAEAAAAAVPGMWQPTTLYTAGSVKTAPDGSTISRIADGTSRASFDSTEKALWEAVLGKTGTIDQTTLTASIDARVPAASTSAQGKVEVADNTEIDAATDPARVLTPAGLLRAVTTSAGAVLTGLLTMVVGRKTQMVTPEDFGAVGDGRTVTDAVLNGTTTVTSATAAFTTADVGKRLVVLPAAGSAQATFAATITARNSATSVTVNTTAGYSGTALEMTVATDDTTALQAWLDDASTHVRFLPGKIYGFTAGLILGTTYNVRAHGTLKVMAQLASPTGWPAGSRVVPTAISTAHATLMFNKQWLGGVLDTSNLATDGFAPKWARQYRCTLQVRGCASGGRMFIFGDDSLTATSYQIDAADCLGWRDFGTVPRSASTLNGLSLGTGLVLTASTDTVTKTAHGLVDGQMVVISAISGGAGLLTNTNYYVTASTTNTFKFATAAGVTQTVKDITTDGTASITYYPLALSVGMDFRESCTDSTTSGKTTMMGCQVGYENHGGNNHYGPGTHAWSRSTVGLMDYAFDDWVGFAYFTGTYADTPQLGGYRARSTTNPSFWSNATSFMGSFGGVDNQAFGFILDGARTGHSFVGPRVIGASSSLRFVAALGTPAGAVVSPSHPWIGGYLNNVVNSLFDTPPPMRTNQQTSTGASLFTANHGQLVPLNNASAITFTINTGVFTGGNWCKIVQAGAGQVTIAAGAGVTLHSSKGATALKTANQWAVATITRDSASETFYIEGDLTT